MRSLLWRITAPGRRFLIITKRLTAGTASGSFTGSRALIILPLNNFGFTFAKGDYILCLNNDVTVITPDWLERMIGQCQRKEVGIVGVKLYYPDDTIQHAGVIIGIGGVAGAMFVGMARERAVILEKQSFSRI